MLILNKQHDCEFSSVTKKHEVTEKSQFTLQGSDTVVVRFNDTIVATLTQANPTYIAEALGEYTLQTNDSCRTAKVYVNKMNAGSDIDQVENCHGDDAVSVYDPCVVEAVDRVNATLAIVNDSINNQTTELTEQLESIGDAISDVIRTIDDGVDVNATQVGKWEVEITNPTDLDELATKIADALDDLDINIAGQDVNLNVNVVNDKLLVEIDNLPTIPFDVEIRDVCLIVDDSETKALQHVVYNEDGSVRRIYYTDTNGEVVEGEVIECTEDKLTILKSITSDTAIEGTDIVVTIRNGTADISVNDGASITFGDTGSTVLAYRTEPHNGVVNVSNLSEGASVFVEYKGSLVGIEKPTPTDQGPLSEYSGTGWWKDTETGIVYNKDVPEAETHTFSGDPIEYVSVVTKSEAVYYGERAATSNITDMSRFFERNPDFNADISRWDTSNVYTMNSMFFGATSFDQDISKWNTSNVSNMNSMFFGATSFNKNIGGWDVSNVTGMDSMFYKARLFNQDISSWNTSNVSNMNTMFYDANAFNQDLSKWCVSRIRTKPRDFDGNATAWTLPRPFWGTCP